MDLDLPGGDSVLTTDMLLVLGLAGFTMVMFVWEKMRSDVVALLVLVLLD